MDTWVLTIYKKHPGGDLVRKHIIKPVIKFDMMGERPVTKCIRITWVHWKEKNNDIALNHSRCFPKTERGKPFDSPTGFSVSHVNGNYPWMSSPPQKKHCLTVRHICPICVMLHSTFIKTKQNKIQWEKGQNCDDWIESANARKKRLHPARCHCAWKSIPTNTWSAQS